MVSDTAIADEIIVTLERLTLFFMVRVPYPEWLLKQTVLLGLYSVLYLFCVYVLVTRKRSGYKVLLGFMTILFTLTTIRIVLSYVLTFTTVGGAQNVYYVLLSSPSNIGTDFGLLLAVKGCFVFARFANRSVFVMRFICHQPRCRCYRGKELGFA